MKNKKIFVLIGVVICLFASFIVSVNALTLNKFKDLATNNPEDGDTAMAKAFGDNYDEIIKNNLYEADIANKIESLMKSYYKELYPSYYGGMYISDDSLNLIVQIVEDNIPENDSEEYSVYKKVLNMDSTIKIEYVKYSYNELNNINDEIVKYFNSDKANNLIYENFSANYVDIFNNRAVVVLIENNEKLQEEFEKAVLFDSKTVEYSKFINFKQGDHAKTTGNLKPGGTINLPAGQCSMGFRTKHNGKNGYMLAGHCATGLNVGGTIATGTLRVKQFANLQSGDYAFIENNSSWTPTNTLAYTATGITTLAVVSYCPGITAGMAVAKAGIATQYTAGTVQYTDVNVRYTTGPNTYITINNLVQAAMRVNCGDSGGPVFTPRKDVNGGPVPIGIVSGGNPSEDCTVAGTTTYFTNINRLPGTLQTGRY